MPGLRDRKTPGVYITEIPAFPPSAVGIDTAIPAFVGYTEKADNRGRLVFDTPIRIKSIAEYVDVFGGPPETTFDFVDGTLGDHDVRFDAMTFKKLKATGPVGLLYDSLSLFYANGGGTCYVVSVGTYVEAGELSSGKLKEGVVALEDQVGPTMLVVPDLSLLPASSFQEVARAMLNQCGKKQDRVALLDVVHARDIGRKPRIGELEDAIQQFRADVESEYRSYGIAYFPYLNTSVVKAADLDYKRFERGGVSRFILNEAGKLVLDKLDTHLQKVIDGVQRDIEQDQASSRPVVDEALNQLEAKDTVTARKLRFLYDSFFPRESTPPAGAVAALTAAPTAAAVADEAATQAATAAAEAKTAADAAIAAAAAATSAPADTLLAATAATAAKAATQAATMATQAAARATRAANEAAPLSAATAAAQAATTAAATEAAATKAATAEVEANAAKKAAADAEEAVKKAQAAPQDAGAAAAAAIAAAAAATAAAAMATTAAGATPAAALMAVPPDAAMELAGVKARDRDLRNAFPALNTLYAAAAKKLNLLPTSAAMAGVMTLTDSTRGVWNAPANIALTAVDEPTLRINDDAQADLNKPLDGKAINVIREFIGRGPVVWGGRTLDGNSNDYRYVQVRRTLIYIEQSVKAAMNPFVFAPNVGQTWVTVTSMISNFLQDLWAKGGLMGATPKDAFEVDCGLGTTMTGRDVLEGYMIVRVLVQMVHPAEFIELTFKQKMENAG